MKSRLEYKIINKAHQDAVSRAWVQMGYEKLSLTKECAYLHAWNDKTITWSNTLLFAVGNLKKWDLLDYYKVGDKVKLVNRKLTAAGQESNYNEFRGKIVEIIDCHRMRFKFRHKDHKSEWYVMWDIEGKVFEKENQIPEQGNYRGDDALEVYLKYFKPRSYNYKSGATQCLMEDNIKRIKAFNWALKTTSSTFNRKYTTYTLNQIKSFFNNNFNNTNYENSQRTTQSKSRRQESRANELSSRGYRRLHSTEFENQPEKAQEIGKRERRGSNRMSFPDRARELS